MRARRQSQYVKQEIYQAVGINPNQLEEFEHANEAQHDEKDET